MHTYRLANQCIVAKLISESLSALSALKDSLYKCEDLNSYTII